MTNLTFMMGEFAAEIPTDRRYAKNHMWAQRVDGDEGHWRFGFSAYAVRLLQDVYFLEWHVDAPRLLKSRQTIGAIESSKAESDLFAPVAGELTEFNNQLLNDPSAINVDKYEAGWLFAMRIAAEAAEYDNPGDEPPDGNLLTAEQYIDHLQAAWKLAERTIKGQIK
ncbi:MAG: glycine cleavage system protein H [Pirellulales bacterium]